MGDESDGYYMVIYHGGKFVRDPILRYKGGDRVRACEDPDTMSLIEIEWIAKNTLSYSKLDRVYFYDPDCGEFDKGIRLMWDDKSTREMITIWLKYKEVTLYLENDVDCIEEVESQACLDGETCESIPVVSAETGESAPILSCETRENEAVVGVDRGENKAGVGVDRGENDVVVGGQIGKSGGLFDVELFFCSQASGNEVIFGNGPTTEVGQASNDGPIENVGLAADASGPGEGLNPGLKESRFGEDNYEDINAAHDEGIDAEKGEGADLFRVDIKAEYLLKVSYLSDGEHDEELVAARVRAREEVGKVGKKKKSQIPFVPLDEPSDEEADPLEQILKKRADASQNPLRDDEADASSDYYDSSDFGSFVQSDEDEEHDDAQRRKSRYVHYNPNDQFPEFQEGMVFSDNIQFKDAIRKYSLVYRRELFFVKNEPERIRVKCKAAAKCTWKIFASYDKGARGIRVKSICDQHSCCVSFKNNLVSSKVIADRFFETIRDNPKLKLKELQKMISNVLKVTVPLKKCARVKHRVLTDVAGNLKEEFSQLWDYANELNDKNPGSTIKVMVSRVTPESPSHFKRMYLCFGALKMGWKEGCRRILGVDGCFLKGPCKCELLTAVGKDANDQMYPVAWAVVEGENRETWEWFIELLRDDLDLADGFNFTIMSDQQKGLRLAIKHVIPRAEHRNCARHVFANWSGRRKAKSYEFCFWEIVKATTEREWENKIGILAKKDDATVKELMHKEKHPKQWTKAFFGEHCKCDMVDNNVCESFNSIILDARSKSIITMLEQLREETMMRIEKKRKFVSKWKYNYGPLVKEKFDSRKNDAVDWQMVNYGENGCEIKKGRMRFIVKLDKRTCSCRLWQVSGIPCSHACAAIWHNGGEPDHYLDTCYSRGTYLKAYSYALHPINGSHEWKKTGCEPMLPPIIPKSRPRRPKKNRRKRKDEPKKKTGVTSRKGTIICCSNCGEYGHNKKGCKNPRISTTEGTASTSRVAKNPEKCKSKGKSVVGDANTSDVVSGQRQQIRQSDNVQQAKGKGCSNNLHTESHQSTPSTRNKQKAATEPVEKAATEPVLRPARMRKPSIKGIGLYTNLKTGEQTFYSGFQGPKSTTAIDGPSMREKHVIPRKRDGNSTHAVASSGTSGKRKASANPVGTQESIKKAKLCL